MLLRFVRSSEIRPFSNRLTEDWGSIFAFDSPVRLSLQQTYALYGSFQS